jgi:hypothetical protein
MALLPKEGIYHHHEHFDLALLRAMRAQTFLGPRICPQKSLRSGEGPSWTLHDLQSLLNEVLAVKVLTHGANLRLASNLPLHRWKCHQEGDLKRYPKD